MMHLCIVFVFRRGVALFHIHFFDVIIVLFGHRAHSHTFDLMMLGRGIVYLIFFQFQLMVLHSTWVLFIFVAVGCFLYITKVNSDAHGRLRWWQSISTWYQDHSQCAVLFTSDHQLRVAAVEQRIIIRVWFGGWIVSSFESEIRR